MGRAPTVSRFSSRGPDYIDQLKNPTDVLKPDILAPGHQIWAAWSPMSVLDPILAGTSFVHFFNPYLVPCFQELYCSLNAYIK